MGEPRKLKLGDPPESPLIGHDVHGFRFPMLIAIAFSGLEAIT